MLMREELAKTIEAYNLSAVGYTQTIARLANYQETYDFFADYLKRDDRILDLACGPANISLNLLKRKQLKITGIDLSEKMIETAKRAIPQGEFLCNNIVDYKSENTFNAVIIGFGVPYLNQYETEELLKNTYANLKCGGYLYLSFMHGNDEGFETPSFNPDVEVYIYYHLESKIEVELKEQNFDILKQWRLPYFEPNGSITTDVVMIAQKIQERSLGSL
ncbi:MAG: methyltransferase domain-containing protein [Chitinivibrionales bacterium]|nr:methyltransferase domain-containing protein [Chitinivibrionales bacterium]MBD3358140.1 methyltransferase domain-containing protein [Chitinivibrionales bacterium]